MKLLLAATAILFVQAVGAQNFNVLRLQQTVMVNGKLTPESVARVVTEIRRDSTQKLIINSSGGDVAAAMQLGSVVRELDLDVEVQEACVSSCANYVFSAGRKKQVADGALVVWHGSVMQKDLRDMVERYRLLSGLRENELSDEQKTWLQGNGMISQKLAGLQQIQAEYFSSIGVDERITRLGQEPVPVAEAWTVTASTMQAFGITNVELPAGYETLAYAQRWVKNSGFKEKLVTLHRDQKTGELSVIGPN